jgi:hypothetical protein
VRFYHDGIPRVSSDGSATAQHLWLWTLETLRWPYTSRLQQRFIQAASIHRLLGARHTAQHRMTTSLRTSACFYFQLGVGIHALPNSTISHRVVLAVCAKRPACATSLTALSTRFRAKLQQITSLHTKHKTLKPRSTTASKPAYTSTPASHTYLYDTLHTSSLSTAHITLAYQEDHTSTVSSVHMF